MSEKTESAPESEPHAEPAEEGRRNRKGRLEGIVPDLLKKVIQQGAEALSDEKIKETLAAEVLKKALDAGNDAVESAEEGFRRLRDELPLPRETVDRLLGRVDGYKDELFDRVTEEVRTFLDKVDLVDALQKVLTSVSFEVSTEIRFVPNEKALKNSKQEIKPEVKARVRMKRQGS